MSVKSDVAFDLSTRFKEVSNGILKANIVTPFLAPKIEQRIKGSPTWESLSGGLLKRIFQVKNLIQDYIQLEKYILDGISFNIYKDIVQVQILPQEFIDLPEINWLAPLLTGGDGKIIGSSRIPPQYTGTVNNNFLTKALSGLEIELSTFLAQNIARTF